MTAWAHSSTYGTTVALGPTQEAVYRFVMGATEGGRRPVFTLAKIAEATGRPVSSVHEALGRLRALGLIGCAARMGRTGGHRLWRVATRAARALDVARHRRAIARILARWREAGTLAAIADPGEAPRAASLWSDAPGPSFREAMHRAGFRPWWGGLHHERARDTERMAREDRGGGERTRLPDPRG